MAFTVDAPTFVTHTITGLPATEPGGTEQSLKVIYRVIPDDEVSVNPNDEPQCRDFIFKVVEDLPELADTKGRNVPFSNDILNQLCDATHLRIALAQGYGWALAQAMRGN